MSIKTISKVLIAFSVVMIFVAMTMDTTVSTGYGRVNNLGLLNDQSNLLILGAIGFLSGVILFASSKVEQTKHDEDEEKVALNAQIREVGFAIEDTVQRSIFNFNRWFSSLDYLLVRIVVFIFIAYSFAFCLWAIIVYYRIVFSYGFGCRKFGHVSH